MKGAEHLLLSTLSCLVILIPWVGMADTGLLYIILFGVAIGSLAPDADAERAAILRRPSSALAHRRVCTSPVEYVFPLTGYAIRYSIYYPLSLVLRLLCGKRYRHEHRGIMHSIAGAIVTSTVLAVYFSLCALIAASWLQRTVSFPVFILFVSLLAGYLLHLLQDSCTIRGVRWMYPLNHMRCSGSLRTGEGTIRTGLLSIALGASVVAIGSARVCAPAPLRVLAPLSLGILCTVWVFYLLSCGTGLRTGG